MNDFLQDVWRGLNASQKYLQSKYFYDEAGDEIFREIMACPEYYLTKCEMDIFSAQAGGLAGSILNHLEEFDLVELGPGDGTKTVHLLRELLNKNVDFTYFPIDISGNVIEHLTKTLPAALPGIKIQGLNGDYFEMISALKEISPRNKVILFLGSNIGNIPIDQNVSFFKALKTHLFPGDLIITGFDLAKDPKIILDAYNDKGGITRRFNLNLLDRINNTLGADFDIASFAHAPMYDAVSGACKSYLLSLNDQDVHFAEGTVHFKEGEKIFMEISQKYTVQQTDGIAATAGFTPVHHFYDSKGWFLDALWQTPFSA